MREVIALILAGGRADRLSVLSKHRPTSAVPFGAKYRIIDFCLSNLAHSEIFRVGILTQYAPASLNRHVGTGRAWDLDRRDGGIRLFQPYARGGASTWYGGTADALVQNVFELERSGARIALVLSGDQVYAMDYGPLVERHRASGHHATLVVSRRTPHTDTRRFGLVDVEGGVARRFDEKPDRSDLRHVFMGIYVFSLPFLLGLLRRTPPPTHLVQDVVQPLLEAGETIGAYEFDGYWEDVGSVDTYYTASMGLLGPHPRLLADPDWPIYSPSEERPPAKTGAGARVGRSLVAHGARIWGTAVNSILSPGVVVEEGAAVIDSIVFHDTIVHRGARVLSAIVDKNVVVGEGAVVGEGEDAGAGGSPDGGASGVTLVGKNAVLPAGVVLGRRCVVDTDVGADGFGDGARVPAGTFVTAAEPAARRP